MIQKKKKKGKKSPRFPANRGNDVGRNRAHALEHPCSPARGWKKERKTKKGGKKSGKDWGKTNEKKRGRRKPLIMCRGHTQQFNDNIIALFVQSGQFTIDKSKRRHAIKKIDSAGPKPKPKPCQPNQTKPTNQPTERARSHGLH